MWASIEEGGRVFLNLVDPYTGQGMAADFIGHWGGFDTDFWRPEGEQEWRTNLEGLEYWQDQIETYQALAFRIFALGERHGHDAVQKVVDDYSASDIDLCAYAVGAALTDFFGEGES